jgi:FAD synthetase
MPKSSNKTDGKIIMAFGTFDFFHAGHENYLKQAKELGETLIVVVARDATSKRVKNKKPEYPERRRLRDVLACPHVDKAILGSTEDKYKVIKKFKPDIIALGYDQFVFTYGLEQFFIKEKLNIEITRMQPFQPETFKSSLIKQSLHQDSATSSTCAQNSEKTTAA